MEESLLLEELLFGFARSSIITWISSRRFASSMVSGPAERRRGRDEGEEGERSEMEEGFAPSVMDWRTAAT